MVKLLVVEGGGLSGGQPEASACRLIINLTDTCEVTYEAEGLSGRKPEASAWRLIIELADTCEGMYEAEVGY